jgi:hypothetical protein
MDEPRRGLAAKLPYLEAWNQRRTEMPRAIARPSQAPAPSRPCMPPGPDRAYLYVLATPERDACAPS